MVFKDKLFVEYPIPKSVSIWDNEDNNKEVVENIDDLISTSVDEMSSDILITEYIESTGMITQLPPETITVCSASLSSSMPYQGNRIVKCSFMAATKQAFVRYYPATITYQRTLKVSDLDVLRGDRLIYAKCYVLWKMTEKELSILKAVNMNVDNGQIDLSNLEGFRDKMFQKVESMKPEILMYSTVY